MNKIFYLLISIPVIFLTIEIFMNLTRRTTIRWEDEKVREVVKRNNNFTFPDIKEENGISKNILQTYKSLDKIPNYVFDNLKNKNKDYKYYFFDDQQCEKYIEKEYGNKLLEKYKTIKTGAHRADIFRLCWLYKNGGVYCDIDTHILLDLDNLVDKIKGDNISIPITHDKQDRKRLLNCMIMVNKGNPLIKKCLENILKANFEEINNKYYYHLYLLIMQETLGNKVNYHFIESNDGDSFSFLLTANKWSIKDKHNNIIAYSRYQGYDHDKGFINK